MDESFLKSLNVLYVEDEVDIIQLVEKRFAPKFNQFLSVTSAEEALEIFKQNSNFDLILTDYLLPGLNGIEFARKILQIKSKVPFILITGYVDMQFLIEAINVGITQFVSKPIQFKLLRNAINNTVESVVLEHLLNKSRKNCRIRLFFHTSEIIMFPAQHLPPTDEENLNYCLISSTFYSYSRKDAGLP